ncbi:MAG TPA: squalene synthase HpnC, partial [Gemmataceae bacterium]|nr:squalene synthase HpnC [Gemmataceae bacterium]
MNAAFAVELDHFGPGRSHAPFDLPRARAYCRRLTLSHYENFTVASLLLPRRLLRHFHAVYAYCRWADDLADEAGGGQRALDLLAWWRDQLLACYGGQPTHPVFVALQPTIERFHIPPQPFLDLLSAFEQDQRVKRYATYEQLLDYCRRSADPVGRLVLFLGEAFDETRAVLSDCVCTALQLANFWQDVSRDHAIGRVYLPEEDRRRFGYDDEDLAARRYTPAFAKLMRCEVERTRELFARGRPLIPLLPTDLRVDVELFLRGGLAVLDRIERAGYDVWARRPVVSKWDKFSLLALSVVRRPLSVVSKTTDEGRRTTDHGLARSYAYCERLARREAGNFYHAFRLLPAGQRRAMSALYSFLRVADDLADGPGTPQDKRGLLEDWRRRLNEAVRGVYSHPLYPALHHAVRRFSVPPQYLHAVLDGVEMDLAVSRYETFADLYPYCHRVASAVGLACIHIWGYRDERAKTYAEAAGLALQLTNILRDLAEDAGRDRIYLPREDLKRFGYGEDDLKAGVRDDRLRALMRFEAERAAG